MSTLQINPNDYLLIRWLFLRGLGIIYLIAFVSFGVQVMGLIGERGILPANAFLGAVRKSLGRKGYWLYPTLAWFNSSDPGLKSLCITGSALAFLLIVGFETTPVLVLLWAGYLSLVSIGQIFLSYQWDALILETGFLAIFLVPPNLLPAPGVPPAPLVIYLFRWLLFRLMFMSGLMKLASRDPTWRNLTAMTFHYETQPLPTPLAWVAHRAPLSFQKLSTLMTLLIELVVPFTFFVPGPLSYVGGGLTLLLQLLILITGNFAFFNWLAILLTLFLYDDAFLDSLVTPGITGILLHVAPATNIVAWGGEGTVLLALLAVFLVFVGLYYIMAPLLRSMPQPLHGIMRPLVIVAESGRIANPYGLFASMTTQRPELIVEGSDDGEAWQAYEFKYKPGPLNRPPPIVAPHQPRLDWQVWFAALRVPSIEPWFFNFLVALLQGTPQVLRLLRRNPFPDHPPRYVRVVLYDYHFSTPLEKRRSGDWWQREQLEVLLPPVGLSEKEG